jgi:hypothetical protein
MVSGTERYVAGEYSYTDFLYDDDATTYPSDFRRYAGNAGDLAELRISTRDKGGLAVRFTLNTMMVPDSTILTLAFDSDRNAKTGGSTLPRDPGMPFPGTDRVLTTWGKGAEWSRWNGSHWITVPLKAHADTQANQVTVTLPKAVAKPTGKWRATLATGLYDPTTGGWLGPDTTAAPVLGDVPATAPGGSKIINLGFRLGEVPAAPPRNEVLGSGSPDSQQKAALAAGEPTRLAHTLDFDLMRRGGAYDNVPKLGMMYRIFASRLRSVRVSTDADPAKGNPRQLSEGKDIDSLHGRYLSPLQPYALYVPTGYEPGRPAPMTYFLHCDGCFYYDLNNSDNPVVQQVGEARNSIVLAPASRGKSGFYVGQHEYDLFEAWNDVARHFTLDPRRTALWGGSMGAHGAYRMALLHPHLFARAVAGAPGMCRGLWYLAGCTGGDDTVLARWTENARNIVVFHLADTFSELTFYPGTFEFVLGPAVNGYHSYESLGYRYKLWSVMADHVLIGADHPQVTEFLGQHVIEPEPFHVTWARMPSTDFPSAGLVHDRAYWLSEITLRDASGALAKGVVDAVSLGFGKSDPTSYQTVKPGVTNTNMAYVETERHWNSPGTVRKENRIRITATNIAALTIDPVAAHVTCDVKVDVQSDGPVKVYLLGCPAR